MLVTSDRFLSLSTVVLPYVLASLFLLSSSKVVNVVEAAHPRRRATVRREGAVYDREITTFTEDGRLAQVEYGLEASLRGSTVGAIRLRVPPTDVSDGEPTSLPITESSSSCIFVCIEHSSSGKMHRIDDHIWMLTAGLAGDARMLANQARRACQNYRLQYGEAPTTKQVACMTADFYHQLTRMGGCRPLGCTSILLGVDDARSAKLFRTDPAGGVEECTYCSIGNSQDVIAKDLMALVASFDDEFRTNSVVEGDESRRRRSCSIARVATTMANHFFRLLDKYGNSKTGRQQHGMTLDVWTIKPMKQRRGGMLATCYSDVCKDSVDILC